MPLPIPKSYRRIALITILLVIGATFRFYDLGLTRHSYDDSYPAYDALRMLDGHTLLMTGQPSSVFVDNPVLMSYLQALPLLIWRSPWGIYWLIVMLNTLTLPLLYQITESTLGRRIAGAATLLYAINPWIVHFSRATWVQALVPGLMVTLAWGSWRLWGGPSPSIRRLRMAVVALIILLQTYIQAWGVLVQVGLLVWDGRRRIPRQVIGLGMGLFLATTAVYGIGLADREMKTGAIMARFVAGEAPHLTREGWDHAVRLVTGRDFEYVWAHTETPDYQVRRFWSLLLDKILALALLVGCGRAFWEWQRKGPRRGIAFVLLLWFSVPILLTSVTAHPVHIHYLLLSTPAGHILSAWGLLGLDRKALRWVAALVLACATLTFGCNLYSANHIVAALPTAPDFDGWSLEAGARVGTTLRALLPLKTNYPQRIYAQGRSASLSSFAATYVQPVADLQYPNYVLFAPQPLVYMLTQTAPAETPGFKTHPERTLHFADGTTLYFLESMPLTREAALAHTQVQVDWPNESGLTLLGYSLAATTTHPGATLLCTTTWRVESLTAEPRDWFVAAVYQGMDAQGNLRFNVGGHGQWGYRWQLEDVYREQIAIPLPADLPAGAYRLRLGLFDSIHNRAYFFRPGAAVYDALEIPLVIE